jgi:hypothetical protein
MSPTTQTFILHEHFVPQAGTSAVSHSRIARWLLFCLVMLVTGCKTHKWASGDFEGRWRLETDGGIPPQAAVPVATFMLGHDGRFVAKSLPHGFLQLDDVKPD